VRDAKPARPGPARPGPTRQGGRGRARHRLGLPATGRGPGGRSRTIESRQFLPRFHLFTYAIASFDIPAVMVPFFTEGNSRMIRNCKHRYPGFGRAGGGALIIRYTQLRLLASQRILVWAARRAVGQGPGTRSGFRPGLASLCRSFPLVGGLARRPMARVPDRGRVPVRDRMARLSDTAHSVIRRLPAGEATDQTGHPPARERRCQVRRWRA
jgi:hypothetical protein